MNECRKTKTCYNCGNYGKTDVCDDCDGIELSENPIKWTPAEGQKAKSDAGKLEIDMVPTQIIRDIAEVRMYGNAKYHDPQNWKTVELRRYINAMLRHTLAFVDDPYSIDPESGIPHYKHAECNWAFISEMLSGRVKEEEKK